MTQEIPKVRKEAKAIGSKVYMTGKPCKRGHITTRRTDSSVCTECMKFERQQLYASGWRPKRNPEKTKASNKKWVQSNAKQHWIATAIRRAKVRAKEQGVPFDLTREYIESIFPDVCPVFGTEFVFIGNKVIGPRSPSIDKIDAGKGYVMGNVAIISMKANSIKHNATSEEIQKVADWLRKQGH